MRERIIKYLKRIIVWLEKKTQEAIIPKSISSLAPKILTDEKDLERIEPYLCRLDDAVNQKGITNIALTGAYGSGKSTILSTFQHKYLLEGEYISISLASFKDNRNDDLEKNDDLERELEISILQQLFYHVDPSKIPDSRFKRIINLTNKKLLIFSLGFVIWILCALIFFKFGYIENLNPATWDTTKVFLWGQFFTTLVSSIGFFAGIVFLGRKIIRLFLNSKINKFNIKGEIELGSEIDKSVFNEHLEEIIYFFQRTNYKVVIIEDLDRFNNTDIFTKLREINILLNKSELLSGREVNFIYAIRDEMFTDKTERVKFFEYIIPVIPFINPSNAGEQLAKLIRESKLEGVLSKDFTEDVITFIDDIDMRLLTNIFHEYVLYKDSLKELDQNNLFAIITFKNIFPNDFAKLHKREGNLYKLLSNKNEYTSQIIKSDNNRIATYELEIKTIQKETVGTIRELRAIYIHAILEEAPNALSFHIDNKEISFNEIIEDVNFKRLCSSSNIEYYLHEAKKDGNSYYSNPYLSKHTFTLNKSFSTIEDIVNIEHSYKEREQIIINKNEGKVNKLKEQISELRNKISVIESKSLTEIFQEVNIDNFIEEMSINTPLIRNLLLNGYINENYNDYISIFHGINMTSQDYSFLRKVKSSVKQNYSVQLTNIDQIIKKLPVRYFKNEAIFNFDLLDYLSKHHYHYKVQYESIIDLIKKETDYSLKFMDEYISNQREQTPFFIQELSATWDSFWDYIYEHPTFDDSKKDNYLLFILRHAKLDSIYSLDKKTQLTQYIENHEQFLSLLTNNKDFNKITSVIKELSIHLNSLELPNDENERLFQFIYENDYYYFNTHNITLLVKKYTTVEEETILCANYTTILESDCEPLKRYIHEFLVDYLEQVFLKLPNNIHESEETILLLLNNEKLDNSIKIKILQKQKTKIQDITKIDSLLIDYELFNNSKVESTWENILTYYDCLEEKNIDDALIAFLNVEENHLILNQHDIMRKDEDIKGFTEKLILSNSLSIDAYKALLVKTPYLWHSINFSDLDSDKAEWLVDNKLSLRKSNLNVLRSYFTTLPIKLIEKKSQELIGKYDDLELNIDDHIAILKSASITQVIKENIITKITPDWIIDNNTLKECILNTLSDSLEHILTYEALDSIIEYAKNIDKRIHLIYNHIGGLDNTQIQSLIQKLGSNYSEIFEVRKKPKFQYTQEKYNLFKVLADKGMISSYKFNDARTEIRVVALYD